MCHRKLNYSSSKPTALSQSTSGKNNQPGILLPSTPTKALQCSAELSHLLAVSVSPPARCGFVQNPVSRARCECSHRTGKFTGFMQSSHGTHSSQLIMQQGIMQPREVQQSSLDIPQWWEQLKPCSSPQHRLCCESSSLTELQLQTCLSHKLCRHPEKSLAASFPPTCPQASSAGKSHPPSHTAQSWALTAPGRKCFNHTLAPAAPGPACHRIRNEAAQLL